MDLLAYLLGPNLSYRYVLNIFLKFFNYFLKLNFIALWLLKSLECCYFQKKSDMENQKFDIQNPVMESS